MPHLVGMDGQAQPASEKTRPANVVRISVGNSGAAEMLQECPVVSASGDVIGIVEHLIMDLRTRQLRYVVVAPDKRGAEVAIPWKALYFDSATAQLVFYTRA